MTLAIDILNRGQHRVRYGRLAMLLCWLALVGLPSATHANQAERDALSAFCNSAKGRSQQFCDCLTGPAYTRFAAQRRSNPPGRLPQLERTYAQRTEQLLTDPALSPARLEDLCERVEQYQDDVAAISGMRPVDQARTPGYQRRGKTTLSREDIPRVNVLRQELRRELTETLQQSGVNVADESTLFSYCEVGLRLAAERDREQPKAAEAGDPIFSDMPKPSQLNILIKSSRDICQR